MRNCDSLVTFELFTQKRKRRYAESNQALLYATPDYSSYRCTRAFRADSDCVREDVDELVQAHLAVVSLRVFDAGREADDGAGADSGVVSGAYAGG